MKKTWLLPIAWLCGLPLVASAQSPPRSVEWALNPPSPCAQDSVVLVFQGFSPIWDQGSFYSSVYVMYRDSIARIAPSGPGSFIVRTIHRPDRWFNSEGSFGVPFGLGRLEPGAHHFTIETHHLTQWLDGSMDSTVETRSLDFDVAPTCPPPPVVAMEDLPWTDSATLTPSPCPWKPMVLTLRGRFNQGCARVLLAAVDDSVDAHMVVRLIPNVRGAGCTDDTPPWTATFPLGLPAPGSNTIRVSFLQQGLNYRWPPLPPLQLVGTIGVSVPPTCGDLPPRTALPYITGIGAFAAGVCEGTPASGLGTPVAIRGVFPNGCRHVQGVEQLPNPLGASLPPLLRLTIVDDACDGGSCLEAETEWCTETRLPSLPNGRYALMIQVAVTGCLEIPGGAAIMDAYTLDVPRPPASAAGGEGTVGVGADPEAPAFALSSPVPNPSTGTVAFRLTVARGGPLDAAILDLSGRRVRGLHHGSAGTGTRTLTWDGRDASGAPAHAGVYFLRVATHDHVEWQRIVRLGGLN